MGKARGNVSGEKVKLRKQVGNEEMIKKKIGEQK